MISREIDKTPEVPSLAEASIPLLAQLCFREDDAVQPSDWLFVFGSYKAAHQITDALKIYLPLNSTTKVMLTGGETNPGIIESEFILQRIQPDQYPNVTFYTETQSTNTLDNVRGALDIADFHTAKTIAFLCKSHAAGRGYLTLRKFFPETTLLQNTYDTHYPEMQEPLSRDNWHKTEKGIKQVWGEYLRIKKYGERDDIEYDEVKGLIDQIGSLQS